MPNRLIDNTDYALGATGPLNLTGQLLAAAPGWAHPVFAESVCLVVHHQGLDAVGIVLNRDFENEAEGLWKHLSGGGRELQQGLLHFGGPDSGPVVAIHNLDELAEFEPAKGVYMAAQIDTLKTLVQTQEAEDCRLKIIVGQAEWKFGELQQQFMERAWLPLSATSELIFQPAATMWAYALRSFGNQMIEDVTGAPIPLDVLAN